MSSAVHSLVGHRIFGGYTISRKIGEGGMGAVYVAENLDLNKKLAVKILLPEWSSNEQIVERFLAEARAASAINHPNIIEILDAAQLPDGSHYMLMEYLDGTPLDNFAKSWGAMAVDMTLAIMAQVCSALDATHLRGIIHRDLKPANLFVSPRPTNQLFTKVLDFGIAKLNDARLAGNIKTGTNAVAGTPAYMSPEQARATRDVDHRADIYSLGVIMYEMLAGTRPYAANSIGELAYQQATSQPPPLAQHRPDLPEAWCHVIESCLATNPNHRPDSTRDLAHALVDATPNGKNIATSVAPLLFTNAPRSAETFRYPGHYGIGVAPSEPQRSGADAPPAEDVASANTMAAASPNTLATGGASVAVAHTMSAAPQPAAPTPATHTATAQPRPAAASAQPVNTTLSAVASQTAPAPAPPSSRRPGWVLPAVVVAAVGVAAITFTLVKSTKGDSPSTAAAQQQADAAVENAAPDAAPARVASPTDAAPKPEPPAKTARGKLVLVNRYRGARVTVDGKPVKLTGKTTQLSVDVGRHEVRVEARRRRPRTYNLEVSSRKVAVVTFELHRVRSHTTPSRPPSNHTTRPPTDKPKSDTKKPPTRRPPDSKKPKGDDFDPDAPAGG